MEKVVGQYELPRVFPPGVLQPESALHDHLCHMLRHFLALLLLPQPSAHVALERHKLWIFTIRRILVLLLSFGVKSPLLVILQLKPELNRVELGMQFQIRCVRNPLKIKHRQKIWRKIDMVLVVYQFIGVLNPISRIFQTCDDVGVLIFITVNFYRNWL